MHIRAPSIHELTLGIQYKYSRQKWPFLEYAACHWQGMCVIRRGECSGGVRVTPSLGHPAPADSICAGLPATETALQLGQREVASRES